MYLTTRWFVSYAGVRQQDGRAATQVQEGNDRAEEAAQHYPGAQGQYSRVHEVRTYATCYGSPRQSIQ